MRWCMNHMILSLTIKNSEIEVFLGVIIVLDKIICFSR